MSAVGVGHRGCWCLGRHHGGRAARPPAVARTSQGERFWVKYHEHRQPVSGSSTRRAVPAPAGLCTARVPPSASTRSFNPTSPEPRTGSARVITAGPTIIRTHARSRRARDRWPDEAPTRPRSTLTTVRVTDEFSQREDEPHPGGTGRRRSSPPEGPASLLHRSENEAPAKRIAASQDPQVRPAGGESMRWHQ